MRMEDDEKVAIEKFDRKFSCVAKWTEFDVKHFFVLPWFSYLAVSHPRIPFRASANVRAENSH